MSFRLHWVSFDLVMQRNQIESLSYLSRVRLEGPNAYPLHDHEFGEVFCIEEGTCEHIVNGVRSRLKAGDCVFIRPHDRHSFQSREKKPFWVLNVCFQWSLYEEISSRYFPKESDIYGMNTPLPKAILLNPVQMQWMRDAFFGLLNSPDSKFHVERYLINLFAEFLPLPEENSLIGPDAPAWMQKAWRQVQQPEQLKEGVSAFSRLCGRSPEHVSREFHKQTGKTLTCCINRLRMDYAGVALGGTNKEIIDIASECGFESLSHFYFCFRRAHRMSPSAFRKRAQKRFYPDRDGPLSSTGLDRS